MSIQTYQDALHYWHCRVNYEQRGMPTDLGELKLERMRLLLEQLGRPEARLRIIHIAGTKGKGSVAAMLANILRCAGHRTGLFTSPHLTHVEERVQIDGQPIAPADLTRHMQEIERAAGRVEALGEAPPTFFEIITALGLLHFAAEGVDFGVLEVGLGGRFDATNACTPLVSIITSISYDHTEQLGTTLDRIAFEKAGIIKPGIPVVSGVLAPEARAVIARIAQERQAPLYQLEEDFTYTWQPGDIVADRKPRLAWKNSRRSLVLEGLELGLWGQHQGQNAAVALEAIALLNELISSQKIDREAVAAGLRTVDWPARCEIVSRRPWIVLDCAHNIASMHALLDTLAAIPARQRYLLFAASRDKDLAGMLQLLAPHFGYVVFTQYASSSRGADASTLAQLWHTHSGKTAEIISSSAAALESLRSRVAGDDLLCITGSVFLAGELRPLLLPA
jgi:dihydrofolate synthase / folylpolyglutamate synthase